MEEPRQKVNKKSTTIIIEWTKIINEPAEIKNDQLKLKTNTKLIPRNEGVHLRKSTYNLSRPGGGETPQNRQNNELQETRRP